jgi:hypothetical protein
MTQQEAEQHHQGVRAQRIKPWAQKITATYRDGVEAFFEAGRQLLDACATLSREEFAEMVGTNEKRGWLPFSYSWSRQFMQAAKNQQRLLKHVQMESLPSDCSTIVSLTRVSDEVLAEAAKAKVIRPDMRRQEVRVLRAETQRRQRELRTLRAETQCRKTSPSVEVALPAQTAPSVAPAPASEPVAPPTQQEPPQRLEAEQPRPTLSTVPDPAVDQAFVDLVKMRRRHGWLAGRDRRLAEILALIEAWETDRKVRSALAGPGSGSRH